MDRLEPTKLAAELDKYDPGYLPEPLFLSIIRLAVLTAIEFIPLRKGPNGAIQVLLFKRPAEDPIWPNMSHTPGTVVRPTDATFEDAFVRLFQDELHMDNPIEPIFIKTEIIQYKRGAGTAIEYIVPFNQEPSEGIFYDIDNLPLDLIQEQKPMIISAAEKFSML